MPKKHKLKSIDLNSATHPNSRKAGQLVRVILRSSRMQQKQGERDYNNHLKMTKFIWFQEHLDKNATSLSKPELQQLILKYINRNLPEFNQLKEEREKRGRPQGTRERLLFDLRDQELKLFSNPGFEVPDLTSSRNVELYRQWKRDCNSLSNIRMITIRNPEQSLQDIAKEAMNLTLESRKNA